MAFVYKVAPGCLSPRVIGFRLGPTCQICDQVDFFGKANVLCVVRRGAFMRVSVALSA